MQRSKIFILNLTGGRIEETNETYKSFKVDYLPYWGAVIHIFKKLEALADQFKISTSKIDGLKVVKLTNSLQGPTPL